MRIKYPESLDRSNIRTNGRENLEFRTQALIKFVAEHSAAADDQNRHLYKRRFNGTVPTGKALFYCFNRLQTSFITCFKQRKLNCEKSKQTGRHQALVVRV